MLEKIRLMKIRNKIEKGYYADDANIKELRELERELISSTSNGFVSKDTYRIKSLIIYNDGIKIIRDTNYSITGFKVPEPKRKKEKGTPVPRKKDRKAKRLAKKRVS